MKFSLSRLLVVVAIVAILCGWWCDHTRLTADKERLNAEAASLYAEHVGDGYVTGGWFVSKEEPPKGRVYDWTAEKDRIEYRMNFGFRPENVTVKNY